MTFVQMIEYHTQHADKINEILDQWRAASSGQRTATRSVVTSDRDHDGTYVVVVEFPSYEAAMANSNLPETTEFAEKIVALCDAPPVYRNLEVTRDESL